MLDEIPSSPFIDPDHAADTTCCGFDIRCIGADRLDDVVLVADAD